MARSHLEQQTRPEDERRHPGRVTNWVLQILLVLYVLGAFTHLFFATIQAGDYTAWFALIPGRLGDPFSSIPSHGPMAWWNPLVWFFDVIPFVVGVLLFYPLPLVALWIAVRARASAPVRSVRVRAWVWVWTAVTVLTFSPWGNALHRWLLD